MPDIYWWKRRKQWVADIPDPATGKRKRWYLGADKADAQAEFHRRMYHLLRGQVDTDPEHLRIADLIGQYIEWNRANRARNTADFREVYLRWLGTRYGTLPAAKLLPQHVERVKALYRQTHAPRSVNHFVTAVKGMYRWAMRQRLLNDNPVQYIQKVPRAPQEKRAVSLLTALRACRLCDKRPPLGDFLRLLLYTGMRRGELVGLPWAAYDPQTAILNVAQHKTVGRTGRPRIIPLSTRAVEVIERQPRTGEAIFSNERGGAISGNAFLIRLKRLRRWHPQLAGITCHVFRHTFVSRLLARGVPPWQVQRIVGHTSQLMTLYYAKAEMRQLHEAVENF